jgi:hypothetical protein
MKFFILISLFFFAVNTTLITPQCRWACDDPICSAVCHQVCNITCDYQCLGDVRICNPPKCRQQCVSDQVVADSCPTCEVVCDPLVCSNTNVPCDPLCEAPECKWYCEKPKSCPPPRCELVCEHPACETFSLASRLGISILFIICFGVMYSIL